MAGNMVGKVLNGRYRITERIGIGGMAEVYRAQDNVLGRVVAIKVMLPQYAADPEFAARFKQEASSAANLQSPYIVNVYDWGHDGEDYFIVMEYLRGSDLKAAITERGAINERKVAQIGMEVCQALSTAHHLDIIHRDIKPQNIMIQPDGHVKVMDFGIARAKNSVKSRTSAVLGTAHYISPEQARGKELTAASDIYSLGVVMYEAATGKLPFDGPDAVSVAMMQVNDQPVPPREVNPNVSPQLENIIMKAMEKDPTRRFSTAREMRQTLSDFLAGRLGGNFAYANAPTAKMGATIPATGAYGSSSTSVMPAMAGEEGAVTPATQFRSSDASSASSEENKGGVNKKAIIGIIVAILALCGIAGFALFGGSSDKISVPDVTNQEQAAAEQSLKDAGLKVGSVTEVYSDTIEKGKVVSTNPTANEKVDKDSTVSLTVSKGKEEVEVPDIRGMSEDEALRTLSRAGFEGQAGAAINSSKYDEGTVAKQTPGAKEKAERGATITYYLSKGEEMVDLSSMNIIGVDAETVASQLEAAGLTVSSNTQSVYSDQYAEGVVTGFSPTGKVKPGTKITLTVSLGKKPVVPSSSSSSSGTNGTGKPTEPSENTDDQ